MKQCEEIVSRGKHYRNIMDSCQEKTFILYSVTVMSSESFASYIVTVTSVEIMYNDCLGMLLFKN